MVHDSTRASFLLYTRFFHGRSFGRGSGFFIPEKRSVAHLRRHSRQRAPDGTKHNGLAPRREEVQKQAKQTPCCAHLPNVPHLPMSPASKPRQTSGTRARGLCPNISRATLPGKNRWAEHCPCYAIAPNLRNRRRSKRNLVLDLTNLIAAMMLLCLGREAASRVEGSAPPVTVS